ncbi:MAG: 1-(5-phosphoribosyl)-5-[(5-phosphoribosylamino)methylideneamino]imidazole-4-carboxamide isomerase [Proteobacteria bacterium]|nr:1-(5-phosphoribosyl)-5-[(5-phosphoribosylamino)methylideneamino]imidazole-4-carboxamide isomerase [Pseudomonadota bacterium]
MILYPAIDLKDGKCVRLVKGDMASATVFNDSPVKQALAFQKAGCKWLHLVDLNGAFEGWPVNGNAVRDILEACPDMKIQLGGGIRNMKAIEYWLGKDIERVILGTVAADNPDFVREAAREFEGKIAVGIDAFENGNVAVRGWAQEFFVSAPELAEMYQDSGVATIIYTDIERDGAMQGPNILRTKNIAKIAKIPVIASGGISSLDDLKKLKNCGVTLDGAIVGRAIYDKRIDVAQATDFLNLS